MSDTPRTDALIAQHTKDSMDLIAANPPRGIVTAHAKHQAEDIIAFARQLERELIEAQASLAAQIAGHQHTARELSQAMRGWAEARK